MSSKPSTSLDQLFFKARSANSFLPKDVPIQLLQQAYDIAKWGPTSMNCQPLRIIFLTTQSAKERLRNALMPGNLDKTLSAPVVAILAHDMNFYEQLPRVFPHNPNAKAVFEGKPAMIEATAFRNGTLQAAYFMLAARSLGLDCGPMSGFNSLVLDAEFFAGTAFKSNFLCNLGYADPTKIYARSPRLDFQEACDVL
jgi:3-hydroxypropanoate dehydrogenase